MPLRSLADFTNPALVIPELRNRTGAEAVDELFAALHQEGCFDELPSVREAVLRRENLASTVVAPGWALPHARIPGNGRLCFALGRCPGGLSWFGPSEASVRILFLFVIPESEARSYLLLVSALSKLRRDPARAEQLLKAPGATDLIVVLKQVHLPEPKSGSNNA